MKTIVAILITLFSIQASAQDTLTGKCWTPEMDTTEFQNQPWFSNNDYLENFLDSIGYPAVGSENRIVGAPQVRFWIPIKFWIYRDDDGIGGPTVIQIQTLMDDLNRRYNQVNNTWIGFYMKCSPTYINNSTHLIKTTTGAQLLMSQNNDFGSINVHLINRFHNVGVTGYSIPFLNASMMPAIAYSSPRNNGDLAHEIGHILGLQHTHQYSAWNWKCLTECVSRTRTWPAYSLCPTRLISNRVCEATGDGLRDTQADNDLINNDECFYNVTFGNDEWGDSYDNPPAGLQDRPNINNIMSYNTATDCVNEFSRLQIGVMIWTLYFKKTNNLGGWANPISTFDDYEPDDNAEMTISINRNIQINQIHERNFHQQWNRVGGYVYFTQCDVDWVRFVAPCNDNYEVFTSAMPNRTNANTRLTLFDNNLVQLAQNDDISANNHFSSLQHNFIANHEYFIRVENMSVGTTGYYNLQVGRVAIQGPSALCSSSIYQVQNLPAGATVTWSASPSGIVTFSPAGPSNIPSTTVTRVGDGNITIIATIDACGSVFTIQMPVAVGTGGSQPYTLSKNYEQQECGTVTVIGSFPPNTIATWITDNGMLIDGNPSPYTKQGKSAVISSPGGSVSGNVTAVPSNMCSGPTASICCCLPWANAAIMWYWSAPFTGEPLQAAVYPEFPDAQYYLWYINGQLVETTYGTFLSTYNWPCTSEGEGLSVKAVTSCGTSELVYGGTYSPICSGGRSANNIRVYPNPATTQVRINLEELRTEKNIKSDISLRNVLTEIRIIRLIDKIGNVRRVVQAGNGSKSVIVYIGDMPTDIYYIEVSDGVRSVKTPVKINR